MFATLNSNPANSKYQVSQSNRILNESALDQSQFHSQFSVIKGFGNESLANQFMVINPHKAKNGGHIVYTIIGCDNEGPFEIFRRYKEFHLLRQ